MTKEAFNDRLIKHFYTITGTLLSLLILPLYGNFCYNRLMKNLTKQQQMLIYAILILLGLTIFFTTTEPIFFWLVLLELIISSYQLYRLWKE